MRSAVSTAGSLHVGRKRVERLMKAAGISGVAARKRQRTTVRLPGVRVAPDLLERDFRPDGPNLTWSADITYISTWEGFLYLAHVQDLFSRLIVGWSMADHLRSQLVVDALEMALHRRRPARGLVHDSDQGCCSGSTGPRNACCARNCRWSGGRRWWRDHDQQPGRGMATRLSSRRLARGRAGAAIAACAPGADPWCLSGRAAGPNRVVTVWRGVRRVSVRR